MENKINGKILDKSIEIKAIELYLSGLTCFKVGNLLKIHEETVRRVLKRNNIKARKTEYRSFNFNRKYFKTIDSKDKAYFLGFLLADGYNSNKSIIMSLQEEDKYILEIFKKYIEYTGDISLIPARKEGYKNQYLIRLNSVELCKDIASLGCIRAKSHLTYFPSISEEFYHHFIRGLFDGDGCIYTNYRDEQGNPKLRFSIIGNKDLIEIVQKILIEACNLSVNKLYYKNKDKNNICIVSFGGNNQVKRIKEWLYKDCEDLFLTRKREKFNKI